MTTISEQQHMDSLRLDTSWQWLCQTRKSAPENADIWDLRYRWPAYRDTFLAQLQSGEYRLSPMRVVGYERLVIWSAEDALALKWVALQLVGEIPLHEKCEHLKGHGGGQASVQQVQASINTKAYRWVCRTDLKRYYGAINMDTLLLQLTAHIARPALLSLLRQFLHYSVEEGGNFHTPSQGIARSCALSPLMGALHLWLMDNYFATQEKIYYARYMDDFLISTPTRWSLRRQVKQLNRYLNQFGFEKHPEKTFIGRIAKGFDWMGAWLTDAGVTDIAPRAEANHQEKLRRLYEQTQHWPKDRQRQRVSEYKKRWERWFRNDENKTSTVQRASSASRFASSHRSRSPNIDLLDRRPWSLPRSILLTSVGFFLVCPFFALSANNVGGTFKTGHGIVGDTALNDSYQTSSPTTCDTSRKASVTIAAGANLSFTSYGWGPSSDGLYYGSFVGSADSDVIIVFGGEMTSTNPSVLNAMAALGSTDTAYKVNFSANGVWSANVPSTILTAYSSIYFIPVGMEQFTSTDLVTSSGSGSLSARLYIGPNAKPGTYGLGDIYNRITCNESRGATLISSSTVIVPSYSCSVSVSPTAVSSMGVRGQTGIGQMFDSGLIQVRGNCLNVNPSTNGSIQLSVTADHRTTSNTGEVDRALALINDDSIPVGSVTFHLSENGAPLLLTGTKYSLPVSWENINFDVSYKMYDLKPGETPAYGVGRGTTKFIIEWP